MYAEMNILIKHRHSSFHLFLELYSSSVPGPFCGRVSKSLPFLSVTIDNESDPIFSDHKISPRYDQNIAEKLKKHPLYDVYYIYYIYYIYYVY